MGDAKLFVTSLALTLVSGLAVLGVLGLIFGFDDPLIADGWDGIIGIGIGIVGFLFWSTMLVRRT